MAKVFSLYLEFQNTGSFLKSTNLVQPMRMNVPYCLTGVDEMHMNNSWAYKQYEYDLVWDFLSKTEVYLEWMFD